MLALWLAELAWLATRHPALPRLSVPLLVAYGLVALIVVRPGARRLALLLVLPAVLLTFHDGRPELLRQGLEQALVFPAFLATILLVRASAAVHPAVERARRRTTALAREARTAGFLAGGTCSVRSSPPAASRCSPPSSIHARPSRSAPG